MLNEIIKNSVCVDTVKIIDTDSLFIQLPCEYSESVVKNIEDEINASMISFMNRHNLNYNDFISMRLKNEFYVRRMIAYKIKRYIACTVDPKTGHVDVEMRGVEGRRAAQGYVVDLVDQIIAYLREGQYDKPINLYEIMWNIIEKIEAAALSYNFNYLGCPINPPKSFDDLKSIGAHNRGMIVYNVLVDDFFGKTYSKGLHVPIIISPEEIRNNYRLREICSEIVKNFSKYKAIKIHRAKRDSDEDFYSKLISDITVPEIVSPSLYLPRLKSLGVRIDIVEIVSMFAKKFNILCFPFYETVSFDFVGEFFRVFQYLRAKYI